MSTPIYLTACGTVSITILRLTISSDTPNLVARHSCVLAYPVLMSNDQKQTLQALLQPVIFEEKLAKRF